ncbi:uncharacterized protein EAF02_000903 [Botrytis sinoallii]|uniref:uncharacterized protein n=1 Tax=Botrytis sinoallii TaxID=1463999 RepID=UPI00190296A8|nr:uncharacterized protein EAF02_000903 [Botrytis sinoallii]KAF7893365.1 hypothetical protein EAF02_000903 [Botrytis sinoallii]
MREQLTPSVNITSSPNQNIPTSLNPPSTPNFPSQENLTSSNAFSSFSPSTATILPQEFNSFTTDSQSPWLPNSNSSSLPASTHQSSNNQYLNNPVQPDQPQQDFVLYESRTPNVHRTPSLSTASALTAQNRRHSSHLASASPLPQNQRVAAIIQSTGHSSNSAFTNRFNSPAQLVQHQHFYASAPVSPAILQQPQRSRPQVPLFSQSTGSIPRTPNMAFQDMDLFGDEFTPFEGGSSTQNSYSSAFSSPAIPTMYDPINNLSSSSSTTNMSFVSPRDLSLRDSFATASAPNSAAFTNLTTPSTYNESPAFEYQDSPFIGQDGLNDNTTVQTGDAWFSLFPDAENFEQANATNSPLLDTRRKSGSATSPMSATSGIRKPSKALPPIIVEDSNDTVAMKRARNTLAARKSRQRKMQRMEELEDEITRLTAEVAHWKEKALRRT